MAVMIPSTLEHMPDTTAGERKLFELFRSALPETCVVRYEVLLGERDYRPDYTLIDPTRGVLIVEVKDWGVSNIVKATTEQFHIKGFRGSSIPKPVVNPYRKCEIYLRNAREQLVAMPILRRANDQRLAVPIVSVVAFPNISRKEFVDNNLDKLIPFDGVLLKEDLAGNGKPFLERYNQLQAKLQDSLTNEQSDAILAALLPDIAIPHVTPGFIQTSEDVVRLDTSTVDTYNLSLDQERIAKSLGEGPRLLRGIAGTGKTLIMLYRAKLMAANYKDQRILVLCWNVSLANYMRQVYERLQVSAIGKVTITNFSQFAQNLFQKYGIRDSDPDRESFSQRFQTLQLQEDDQYDAIYIDEAQDFRKEWIGTLFQRLLVGDPEKRNLLIAADDAQRIYHNRDFKWTDLGIPMQGRSSILKTVYRNSARVWIFAAFLLKEKATYITEDKNRVSFSSKGGYDPLLVKCNSYDAQIDKCIDTIRAMQKKTMP